MNLNEAQSIEDNRSVFIARLVAAGWSTKEAEEERENVQQDEEGEL